MTFLKGGEKERTNPSAESDQKTRTSTGLKLLSTTPLLELLSICELRQASIREILFNFSRTFSDSFLVLAFVIYLDCRCFQNWKRFLHIGLFCFLL